MFPPELEYTKRDARDRYSPRPKRLGWSARLAFLALTALFVWLAFRAPNPLSSAFFGLFAFWTLWSALFAQSSDDARGGLLEPVDPSPPSEAEGLMAGTWFLIRKLVFLPISLFFLVGSIYLIGVGSAEGSSFVAAAVLAYCAYRAWGLGMYGQGLWEGYRVARKRHKERLKRYGLNKDDAI